MEFMNVSEIRAQASARINSHALCVLGSFKTCMSQSVCQIYNNLSQNDKTTLHIDGTSTFEVPTSSLKERIDNVASIFAIETRSVIERKLLQNGWKLCNFDYNAYTKFNVLHISYSVTFVLFETSTKQGPYRTRA